MLLLWLTDGAEPVHCVHVMACESSTYRHETERDRPYELDDGNRTDRHLGGVRNCRLVS